MQKANKVVFPTDWARRCKITIDSDLVSANLSNFPVLLTEDNLPSEMFDADGIYPALNGGGDLRFSSDQLGANQLACEVVSFTIDNDPSNGLAEVWVKVPSVSGSVDTDIYVWYKKSGETQPARDATYGLEAVWTEFLYVAHMNNATSTTVSDSTSNEHTGTKGASTAATTEVTGKIGKAQQGDGIDDYISLGDISAWEFGASDTFTVQLWANVASDTSGFFFGRANGSGSVKSWTWVQYLETNGWSWGDGDGSSYDYDANYDNLTAQGWEMAHTVVQEQTTGDIKKYVNGAWIQDDNRSRGQFTQTANDFKILGDTGFAFTAGSVDEIRIYNGELSTAWIVTDYNSQNSPLTFATASTPTTPSGAGNKTYQTYENSSSKFKTVVDNIEVVDITSTKVNSLVKLELQDGAVTPPLNIAERSAVPTTPAANDIYLDDGTNTTSSTPSFRRYTGAAWEDIAASAGGGGNVEDGTAAGQLNFWDGSSEYKHTETTEIFWDDTNKRLGIGTATPNNTIQVANYIEFDDTLFNTFVGYTAGEDITTGDHNTALGYNALKNTTDATGCVAIGSGALTTNTTGDYNIAMGKDSLKENLGGLYNTGIGFEALKANTSGTFNSAVGYRALERNTIGRHNFALGTHALYLNTEGDYNVAIGYQALYDNSTADKNVGIGYAAFANATTGGINTGIGFQAGLKTTSGAGNIAIGPNTLYQNLTGNYNIAIGSGALFANTAQSDGIAIGRSSLYLATGRRNIGIGYAAGNSITIGVNNIVIGYNMDVISPTSHYQINIGDAFHGLTNTRQVFFGNYAGGTDYTEFDGTGNIVFHGASKVTGLKLNTVAKTAAYTATGTDDVITCGAGNETFTISLPAVVDGKTYYIKNVGTGVITVDANSVGSTTIDGVNTKTLAQYDTLRIVSDASVYWII